LLQTNPGHIIPQSTDKDGSSGLPLSFRSTIYLDVFGWHSRHFSAAAVVNAVDGAHHWENAEKMLYDAMETRRKAVDNLNFVGSGKNLEVFY